MFNAKANSATEDQRMILRQLEAMLIIISVSGSRAVIRNVTSHDVGEYRSAL